MTRFQPDSILTCPIDGEVFKIVDDGTYLIIGSLSLLQNVFNGRLLPTCLMVIFAALRFHLKADVSFFLGNVVFQADGRYAQMPSNLKTSRSAVLYSLHVEVQGRHSFPVLFGILPNSTEQSFRFFFRYSLDL